MGLLTHPPLGLSLVDPHANRRTPSDQADDANAALAAAFEGRRCSSPTLIAPIGYKLGREWPRPIGRVVADAHGQRAVALRRRDPPAVRLSA